MNEWTLGRTLTEKPLLEKLTQWSNCCSELQLLSLMLHHLPQVKERKHDCTPMTWSDYTAPCGGPAMMPGLHHLQTLTKKRHSSFISNIGHVHQSPIEHVLLFHLIFSLFIFSKHRLKSTHTVAPHPIHTLCPTSGCLVVYEWRWGETAGVTGCTKHQGSDPI